ncbi:hypothetical protein CF336_g9486 [Tilletia laevis]|uniref:Uncharacterized protein n=1 Tax=Tilletia caries TaxID=13290 RepID=A0A8T8THY6_9BASI|nr:hypothetical protein CF336_g9486 [Tilletia laevis]KAE8260161.1 hypothetical protein A4X03_0g3902 [Tilletia caries]CAD7068693.1 unnamed protein product [Tilletia caries]
MVGDRLDTDIEFAINGGIDSLMVQTGISPKAEIDAKDAKVMPTYSDSQNWPNKSWIRTEVQFSAANHHTTPPQIHRA